MDNYKVVGIILAYNSAPFLEDVYKRIPKNIFYKIIIVDDGSKDESAQIAKELGLSYFTHPHSGYGGNIKYGLQKAFAMGADYAVEIHGDGQYDPSAIPAALKLITQSYGLVIGSRFIKQANPMKDGMPLTRYSANKFLSYLARKILKLNLSEFHSGFRIYSKKLIKNAPFKGTSDDYIYSFEIILQAHYTHTAIGEVPIRCNYNKDHTSINYAKSIVYFFQVLGRLGQYLLAKNGVKLGIFRFSSS